MQQDPLITTIIPTYQRPHLLKRAIQSALDQTMPLIQVCIYDNASQDETANTVETIAKKDRRVKYHRHPNQIDAAANFQFGIKAVNTPFFSLLADDDLLMPDFYETALAKLKAFPSAQFFLGSTIDVKENGDIVSANALRWEEKCYDPPFGLYHAIKNYFNWTGALFRKEVRQNVTIDPSLKPIDLDFVLRLAAQSPFVVSKKPCALFFHHPHSYSIKAGSKLVWPSWPKIVQNLEAIQTLSEREKKRSKEFMQTMLQKMFVRISLGQIVAKEFEEARKTLALFKEQFPQNPKGKMLHSLLNYAQKQNAIHWLFQCAFRLLQAFKTLRLQWKYRRLVKKTC